MRHMKISSGWDMYNVAVIELYKTEEKLRKAEIKMTNKVAKLQAKVEEARKNLENIKASLENDIRSDEVWDNFLMVDQLRHG